MGTREGQEGRKGKEVNEESYFSVAVIKVTYKRKCLSWGSWLQRVESMTTLASSVAEAERQGATVVAESLHSDPQAQDRELTGSDVVWSNLEAHPSNTPLLIRRPHLLILPREFHQTVGQSFK